MISVKTTKKPIQNAILSLINQQIITQQNEILRYLETKGFRILQASLSRLLKRMNVIKVNGQYTQASPELKNNELLYIDIAPPNIIVLHTFPGLASSIAYKLDQFLKYKGLANKPKIKGIIGTVAGDDTVVVVIDIKYALSNIKMQIENYLYRVPS